MCPGVSFDLTVEDCVYLYKVLYTADSGVYMAIYYLKIKLL